MSGAISAAAKAQESDSLLQKVEARIGKRLDEAVQTQVRGTSLGCTRAVESVADARIFCGDPRALRTSGIDVLIKPLALFYGRPRCHEL